MYNFLETKDKVLGLVQREGDSDYRSLIGDWMNFLLLTMYNQYDYWAECQDRHTFATVASTEEYFMPLHFNKPFRVYDFTNNTKLNVITDEVYTDANITNVADAVTAKVPSTARFYGTSGVLNQVSTSGDTVQAKSSVTETVTVRIEGYIDSSLTVIAYENISVTGTVAVAGTVTFFKILHVSKSKDTTGFITLEDSSANDLTLLGPTDRVAQYSILKLGLIPNQVNSMRVYFKKNFPKLINDNDYPFVEADDYLLYGAAALAIQEEKEQIQRAQLFQSISDRALEGILQNQYGKLGPDYQNSITFQHHQAHRA